MVGWHRHYRFTFIVFSSSWLRVALNPFFMNSNMRMTFFFWWSEAIGWGAVRSWTLFFTLEDYSSSVYCFHLFAVLHTQKNNKKTIQHSAYQIRRTCGGNCVLSLVHSKIRLWFACACNSVLAFSVSQIFLMARIKHRNTQRINRIEMTFYMRIEPNAIFRF